MSNSQIPYNPGRTAFNPSYFMAFIQERDGLPIGTMACLPLPSLFLSFLSVELGFEAFVIIQLCVSIELHSFPYSIWRCLHKGSHPPTGNGVSWFQVIALLFFNLHMPLDRFSFSLIPNISSAFGRTSKDGFLTICPCSLWFPCLFSG